MKPRVLYHCLQGWPPEGPNAFRWENGTLVYMLPTSSFRDDWDKSCQPPDAQWDELWRLCDQIDIWSWPAYSGDPHVKDGLQWIIRLEVGDRKVETSGQIHGSPPDYQGNLLRLHDALQRMTGWSAPERMG